MRSKEVPCSEHPDALHSYDRNGSHNNDRYTCECEGWEETMIDGIIFRLNEIRKDLGEHGFTTIDIDEEISFMEGLK